LNLTVDFSKYHDSRIDRAFFAGEEETDVAVLQTVHDFPRWKGQNRLLLYKPPTFDDIYSGEKDLDGAFIPIGICRYPITLWHSLQHQLINFLDSFGSFVYDSTKVVAADIPRNYQDVLDQKWKGKLVLTYPNDDDAVLYLFSLIIQKYGFEWLDALSKQDVLWVRGSETPSIIIFDQNQNSSTSTPNRVLSFSTGGYGRSSAAFISRKNTEAPEQMMSWAQTAAIFASTKRPESAKLFLAWMASEELQKPASVSSAVPLKSLDLNRVYTSNVTQVSGFRIFMHDRTTVDWWKLQFETSLGIPQGASPLDLYNY
jgi:ABC-type Fe3+ transport system substrate-binding protein